MKKLVSLLQLLAARVREPSTHAGLAALGVLTGLPPGAVDAVVQGVVGAAAVAAIVLPEAKPGAAS